MEIQGNLIDIHQREIYPVSLEFHQGRITGINKLNKNVSGYILPGLVDAHLHVESSMLIPSEFARAALGNGVIAAVTDPHEIANVLGKKGVDIMIDNGRKVPFKFFYGAPSCVPATSFENSGGEINLHDIEDLFREKEVKVLSEMMNFPGVIHQDPVVMKKIAIAKQHGLPVDGHIPGIRGEELEAYIQAGISTDHECTDIDEAREKIQKGMKILIREGSAAKNFDALIDLIDEYPDKIMFCSDDIHPDDLKRNYLLDTLRRGIKMKKDLYNLIRSCTLIPRNHYGLDVGCVRKGDPADFIIVDSLNNFNLERTFVNGELVFANNITTVPRVSFENVDVMKSIPIESSDISLHFSNKRVNIIHARENQIITTRLSKYYENERSIIKDKVNKIVVINRYNKNQRPAVGYLKGFDLDDVAIAQTIAHDSHNIIAIGNNDGLLVKAINQLISLKGGITACSSDECQYLQLNFGGLMSSMPLEHVANKYTKLKKFVLEKGCGISEPFMTLSFMALLVIPSLKISDKGLFDVTSFTRIDLLES